MAFEKLETVQLILKKKLSRFGQRLPVAAQLRSCAAKKGEFGCWRGYICCNIYGF